MPPTMRDFSVFEQHIEGVIKDANPDATVPPVWYESPFCYFTNPHAVTGPGDEIPVPPGCRRLDFELEVAAVIGRPGRDLDARRGRRVHRRLHDLQRLVRAGSADGGDAPRPRDVQGQGLREHARTVDRHARRARALPSTAIASTSSCAPSSTGARSGPTRSRTWRGAFPSSCRTRRAGTWVRPGRRARLGDVRQRLPARAVGPARPRRSAAARARRRRVAPRRGDRNADQHGGRRRRAARAAAPHGSGRRAPRSVAG